MTIFAPCYCCTCEEIGDALVWDAACPNHGAHGIRGCAKHGTVDLHCTCGCGHVIQPRTTDTREGKAE